MPEYVMDTDSGDSLPKFNSLPSFVQGYLTAAFWTESNEMYDREEWDSEEAQDDIREGRVGGTIPKDAGYADITEETLADIKADCEAFQSYAADLLEKAYEGDYSEEQAGHDYWLTRNGHGTGFWDRDALKADGLGDRLSKRARKQGNVDLFWQDGKVYFE